MHNAIIIGTLEEILSENLMKVTIVLIYIANYYLEPDEYTI